MNVVRKLSKPFSSNNWIGKLFGQTQNPASRYVCFFVPTKSKGWILEAVCNEIAQRLDSPSVFCENYKAMPKAAAYFFCHYHFYLSAIRINPWLKQENCVVWFTHPKDPEIGGPETIHALRDASVVTMCSKWRSLLIEKGLSPNKVTTIVGAANPDVFPTHTRSGGKVGFCTAYYERKKPERILQITQQLPEFDFVLLGRNWNEFPQFEELCSLENFEYREASYDQYPAFYRELDVFVSASQLEGGPIPLLESMMSNVVPVASDTGFAPDVIRHGENGFLYSAEEQDVTVITDLVRQAKKLTGDVRQSVLPFNWQSYADQHAKLFKAA